MRKHLLSLTSLLFLSLIILLASCSDDSDTNTNTCASIESFTIMQEGKIVTFDINSTGASLYQISVVQAGSSQDGADSGMNYTIYNEDLSIPLLEQVSTGDYLFYVRTICNDNSRGEWSGPVAFTLNEYCRTPENLLVDNGGVFWSYNDTPITASNFQIQYGPQGFTLGNGTSVTVNNTYYYSDAILQQGLSYDFYVRAYCVNNVGYGSWTGPYTYLAESDQNMCTAPSNVTANVELNWLDEPVGATFSWDANGESSFEHTIVLKNHDISEGEISAVDIVGGVFYNLVQNTNYDFYVRAVCQNGNKTAWVKKSVNIGD